MAIKIYYVDDETDLCENFEDAFSSSEREIFCFTDSIQAMKAIESSPPDILFLDYRMPGLNGVELAEKLNSSFPIVLITGEINIQSKFQFRKVLNKPYSSEDILDLINEIKK